MFNYAHLSPSKVIRFLAGKMSPSESDNVVDHYLDCNSCERLCNLLAWLRYNQRAPINIKSEMGACLLDAELALFAEHICSGKTRRRVTEHLSVCKECHKLMDLIPSKR